MAWRRWIRRLRPDQDNESASKSDVDNLERESSLVASKPVADSILGHKQIDPQLESPFYGRLPLELREMIWDYALRRYQDTSQPFSRNEPYRRPGQEGPARIAVGLLLTCRAIYLETYKLPIRLNALTDLNGDKGSTPPGYSVMGLTILNRLAPWQFANLSALDLTMQQNALENEYLGALSNWLKKTEEQLVDKPDRAPDEVLFFGPSTTDMMMNRTSVGAPSYITHLTIRLGRTDWWNWSHDPLLSSNFHHLALDPAFPNHRLMQNRPTASAMAEASEKRRQGLFEGHIDPETWGYQISMLKNVKEFKLILETFPAKKAQIDKVVECAKSWRFDMHEGYELEFAEVESTARYGDGTYDLELKALEGWHVEGYDMPESLYYMTDSGDMAVNTHTFEVRTMKWKLARKEKPAHCSDSE
ncbi:MAG: hypothetical protein M1831_004579 [Alyxoria varia]|nr:MAG: hypothetical protein M1831_004579 [Alyxoria varia]